MTSRSPDESMLGQLINHRLDTNRDLKMIITSKSSSTGLGKTTLAIMLCRYADRNGWTDDKAFLDVSEYIDAYLDADSGDALLQDEVEHAADRRRAMSQSNVDLSHSWATLRYKNVVSVLTLPTTSMLDRRMMELGDIWINVVKRGVALPYYLYVDDHTHDIWRVRLRDEDGNKEAIIFEDLDGDPEFEEISREKERFVLSKETRDTYGKEDIDKAKKERERETKKEITQRLLERDDMNQTEIGDIVGWSQPQVSKIARKVA